MNNSTNAPVAFQLDSTNLTVALEQNSIEGLHGAPEGRISDLKTPAGVRRLPQR